MGKNLGVEETRFVFRSYLVSDWNVGIQASSLVGAEALGFQSGARWGKS